MWGLRPFAVKQQPQVDAARKTHMGAVHRTLIEAAHRTLTEAAHRRRQSPVLSRKVELPEHHCKGPDRLRDQVNGSTALLRHFQAVFVGQHVWVAQLQW